MGGTGTIPPAMIEMTAGKGITIERAEELERRTL